MILDRLRLRRKKKEKESSQIARSDFLNIMPVRNPAVQVEKDEKGKITLILLLDKPKEEKAEPKEEEKKPEKEKKPSRRERRRGPPSAPPVRQRKYHLDTIGSIVWEMCDGQKTVRDLVKQLHDTYKMLPSEAEISLNSYFNDLAKRGLVAFLIPNEIARRMGKKEAEEEEKKPKQPDKKQ
jgi:hypothetical protein